MKNRIHTAPVIRSERNGRRMSPFSWRSTPRLTFVSCHPIRRRSKKRSFRGAGAYGPDGTVGVGVHMGTGRPCRRLHLNPPPENPPSRMACLLHPSRTVPTRATRASAPGKGLDRPGPVLNYGLAADLHGPVGERRREAVAAVVLAAQVAVVPDADAHGARHDAVLQESRKRLRVESETDSAEHVLRAHRFGPIRLGELQVLLRGEIRDFPVAEGP